MSQGSHRPSRDTLSDAQSQFERWRQNRIRGTRIPETLWQAAAEAAGEYGVSRTSQALGLDYYGLKKRVESTLEASESEPAAEREFLEIPLFASAADCVLELVDAQGTRLRVELRGSAAAHCQTLAQTLWSTGR